MGRPGIMLYFDILEPIQLLTDAERGKLLMAILEYGKNGKKPNFRGKLALAWGFVQPKIDRDGDSYDMVVLQRKYAAFCSRRSYNGFGKIEFEDWLALDEHQRKYLLNAEFIQPRSWSAVDGCAPATSTTATTKTNTITNTSSSISVSAPSEPVESAALLPEDKETAERNKLKVIYGDMKRGNLAMTETQMDLLLDKMGSAKFGEYLGKLDRGLKLNGKPIQKDYTMMLHLLMEETAC